MSYSVGEKPGGANAFQKGDETMAQDKTPGPKFVLDVEGDLIPWDFDNITTEQVAGLGGWDISLGVILIDLKENTERTLAPGESVQLKPGMGFSKKVRFKRG